MSDYENMYGEASANASDFLAEASTIVALGPLLIGFVFAFFGLKLFKCMLCLIGFTLGTVGGWCLGTMATKDPSTGVVIGVILGIFVGIVVMWARRVAYFVFGAGLGVACAAALTIFVIQPTHNVQNTLLITGIILGIGGGVLAVFIGDYIVIGCTGISGAADIAFGVGILLKPHNYAILILPFVISAVLGIWFQIHNMHKWKSATAGYGGNVIVQTEVNTNVTTNNTVELLIQAPQAQQYPPQMYPSGYPPQGYPVQQGYPPQQGYPAPVQTPVPVHQV